MNKKNTNSPLNQFRLDIQKRSKAYQKDAAFKKSQLDFHNKLSERKYSYNFFWLGVPIIKTPAEIQAYQELVWQVKPDLIIETGIAWGGSILLGASLLTLLEECGEIKNGQIVGIDLEVWPKNKKELLAHPLGKKITILEGSSIAPEILKKVSKIAKKKKRILVRLDSNHTHEHVLAELKAYAPFVTKNSYFVVDDTIVEIEDRPKDKAPHRPWGKGNNPKTAVTAFLKENKKFKIDKDFESIHPLTGSPDGFLKRIT